MVYVDIQIPLEVIKDGVKLYYIVQHRTTICIYMYLEVEVARKLFLPYEIKKFQRGGKNQCFTDYHQKPLIQFCRT